MEQQYSKESVAICLKAALESIVSGDFEANKVLVLLVDDSGEDFSRGLLTNGLSAPETLGLMEYAKHDIIASSSSTEFGGGDDWRDKLKSFGIDTPKT